MRIALTGNPNSGKTTMYNALTGSSEKVGNWAGVTVDKKEHLLKRQYLSGKEKITAVDLPGAYSMSAFTSEESITSTYIKEENPDVIVNIVDSTNLSRSLFFTTQILELGIPVVVALNKSDINKKKGTMIDAGLLSAKLGCPVVETVSTSSGGLKKVIEAAVRQVGKKQNPVFYCIAKDINDKKLSEECDRNRFDFVNKIVNEVEVRKVLTREKTLCDKADVILTNKWIGIPLFAFVMWLVFQISQVWVGTPISDWLVLGLETLQSMAAETFSDANPLLSAILIDGIMGGVIAVVGFLPLVMVMYFLIALLEDCGYMSRVAVVLDPIFKRVGLSGKSVIPFVVSVGCAVPGVMASRTIHDERERRTTAMLAPFMPCGAKIPVIALFAGAFFDGAGWVSTLVYLLGIVIIFLGALLINKITGYKARKSFFIIELSEYKIPGLWGAFKSMCSRGWEYILKAATIILLCNMAVQIMQSFTWTFELAGTADESILASVAGPFAYVLYPVIGVVSWQLAAATITGFIAKENVVATLAVCFAGLNNLIDAEEFALVEGAGGEVAASFAITKAAALAYLIFNLYSPPCFAAIGAMNAEMKSRKCLWGGIGLQFAVGYTISYFVYTLGTIFTEPQNLDIAGAVTGLCIIALIALVISRISYVNKNSTRQKSIRGVAV